MLKEKKKSHESQQPPLLDQLRDTKVVFHVPRWESILLRQAVPTVQNCF